ncbi:MAG: hypothetical protein HY826_01830 [Actinobacteria bacterium]|nr:hypothetical protein [Actinomycetota bacterium]
MNSLRVRLDELEAEVRSLRSQRADAQKGRRRRRRGGAVEVLDSPEPVSRRRMLGMLKGAAAAGAGMAVISSAESAYATAVTLGTADGDALQIGGSNTNTIAMTSLTGSTTSGNPVFKVTNNAIGPGHAIQGFSGAGGGFALYGQSDSDSGLGVFGVNGASSVGVGVAGASASGPGIRVMDAADAFAGPPPTVPIPPSTGTWSTGSLVNSAGQLWYCYVAGVGSASKWARLSSPFVPVSPTRVYDSRAGAPSPTGLLVSGSNRLVSVADGRDGAGAVSVPNLVPAGAKAVTANVTVTGTTGGFGYLAINPGGNTVEGASTINWFGAGQTLANGVTLTLNASREVTVICNGGGSTQFIIDVSGYYL